MQLNGYCEIKVFLELSIATLLEGGILLSFIELIVELIHLIQAKSTDIEILRTTREYIIQSN